MKKILICAYIILSWSICRAQVPVNNPIDPADTELVRAVDFLSRYLNEFTRTHLPDYRQYWSAEDCVAFKRPDQLVYGINTEIPTYIIGKPTILYAKPENGYVHIKTLFGMGDSGKISVMSITNHYVGRDEHGQLHFINPMNVVNKDWKTTVVGSIIYHYPAYHVFDRKKAKALEDLIAQLQKDWGLAPINIRYYFADTKEELEHLRGFDFTVAMGNRDKPSGMSDDVDDIVYCGGWGENYFHEVVHVYLNRLYPQSPLREGIAVLYGGSMGHDVRWHLQRLNAYLQQHQEIDLNDPGAFYYLDNYTNPYGTICGMLCLDAYTRGGITKLKSVMAYTSLKDILYKEYGISPGGWNSFLRKMIAEYSK